MAHELLARPVFEELGEPATLLSTAETLGRECALSRLVRREGVRAALASSLIECIYVNTHPREIVQEPFLASLYELRCLAPRLPVTIEVHEAAVTESGAMRRLREVLNEYEMSLACDDFGAGQARFRELCEEPPEVLKFDIGLVRDLDTAPAAQRGLVESLVRMTRDLGVTPLAEGIETEPCAAACREAGFELAQGYLFGKPAQLPA